MQTSTMDWVCRCSESKARCLVCAKTAGVKSQANCDNSPTKELQGVVMTINMAEMEPGKGGASAKTSAGKMKSVCPFPIFFFFYFFFV